MSARIDNMKAFGASAAVAGLGVSGMLAALSTRSAVPAALVTLTFLTADFLTVSAIKNCYGSAKSALAGIVGGSMAGIGGIALAFNALATDQNGVNVSPPSPPQGIEVREDCPQALPTLRAKACPLPAPSFK